MEVSGEKRANILSYAVRKAFLRLASSIFKKYSAPIDPYDEENLFVDDFDMYADKEDESGPDVGSAEGEVVEEPLVSDVDFESVSEDVNEISSIESLPVLDYVQEGINELGDVLTTVIPDQSTLSRIQPKFKEKVKKVAFGSIYPYISALYLAELLSVIDTLKYIWYDRAVPKSQRRPFAKDFTETTPAVSFLFSDAPSASDYFLRSALYRVISFVFEAVISNIDWSSLLTGTPSTVTFIVERAVSDFDHSLKTRLPQLFESLGGKSFKDSRITSALTSFINTCVNEFTSFLENFIPRLRSGAITPERYTEFIDELASGVASSSWKILVDVLESSLTEISSDVSVSGEVFSAITDYLRKAEDSFISDVYNTIKSYTKQKISSFKDILTGISSIISRKTEKFFKDFCAHFRNNADAAPIFSKLTSDFLTDRANAVLAQELRDLSSLDAPQSYVSAVLERISDFTSAYISQIRDAIKKLVHEVHNSGVPFGGALSHVQELQKDFSSLPEGSMGEAAFVSHFKSAANKITADFLANVSEKILPVYKNISRQIEAVLRERYSGYPEVVDVLVSDIPSLEEISRYTVDYIRRKAFAKIKEFTTNTTLEAFLIYAYNAITDIFHEVKGVLFGNELKDRLAKIVGKFFKGVSSMTTVPLNQGTLIKIAGDVYAVLKVDNDTVYLADYALLEDSGYSEIFECPASLLEYEPVGTISYSVKKCPISKCVVRKDMMCVPCVYGMTYDNCYKCLGTYLAKETVQKMKRPIVVTTKSSAYDKALSSVSFHSVKKPIATTNDKILVYDVVMHKTGRLGVVSDTYFDGSLRVIWADNGKSSIVWQQEVKKVDESSL